ncbi:MAG: sulfite exporter TauE/SafE family protein [Phycisphaerales bacterium]|nr:MAG: sulfite exporter TauE/SafE family protein [Phycisphaerales bacterium]
MSWTQIIELIAIGLVGGTLGGMLGIGGSIIMIPALALVLGPNQHLYQAAAMIVNIFVAVPATLHHARSGAIRMDVFKWMLPFGIVFILLGVWLSDQLDAKALQQIFGVFLLYIIGFNVVRLIKRRPEPEIGEQRAGPAASGSIGSIMGFLAGLLGIGGGGIAVPLLQRIANLPLRQCIGTSSAVMCLTALVGAICKNWTLAGHPNEQFPSQMLHVTDSLLVAGCLAPTALIGGYLGAHLTHRLPLFWVRLAFTLLMMVACARMFGLI